VEIDNAVEYLDLAYDDTVAALESGSGRSLGARLCGRRTGAERREACKPAESNRDSPHVTSSFAPNACPRFTIDGRP
jgi:hypothetical protein